MLHIRSPIKTLDLVDIINVPVSGRVVVVVVRRVVVVVAAAAAASRRRRRRRRRKNGGSWLFMISHIVGIGIIGK